MGHQGIFGEDEVVDPNSSPKEFFGVLVTLQVKRL